MMVSRLIGVNNWCKHAAGNEGTGTDMRSLLERALSRACMHYVPQLFEVISCNVYGISF